MAEASSPLSWSEGRGGDGGGGGGGGSDDGKSARQREAFERFQKAVGRLDAALAQLADDKNFQQDIRVGDVSKALRHWTGRERLSASEAGELFDPDSYNFRTHIRPCLAELARLQHECKQANIGLPLDRILAGCRTLVDPPGHSNTANQRSRAKKGAASSKNSKENKNMKGAAADGKGDVWAPKDAAAAKAKEAKEGRRRPPEEARQAANKLAWWMQAYGLVMLAVVACFVFYHRHKDPFGSKERAAAARILSQGDL